MVIGSKIYRQHTVDDSMAWAFSHIDDAPDGSVFLADILTNARGRQQRIWHMYEGQLIVTILLKPSATLWETMGEDIGIRLNQLSMALSLGILEPLKPYGIKLKWPNDFVAGTKKIGGMLVQVAWKGALPHGIVVGFALNINNEFLLDDPLYSHATSIKTITGSVCDRRALYKNIIAHLTTWYLEWKQHNSTQIYKQWRNEQAYLGHEITVHHKDGSIVHGHAQQVLPNGDLVLSDATKKQKIISFYQIEGIAKH